MNLCYTFLNLSHVYRSLDAAGDRDLHTRFRAKKHVCDGDIF